MARKKLPKTNLPTIRVSVRELVEFVLRAGGLGRESRFVSPRRALEGARAHQRIQKSRPPEYEAEVFLTREVVSEKLVLRVTGRIDGLVRALDHWHIEEIKSLTRPHDGECDPLHWAQAKIYAAMLAASESAAPRTFELQLTYVELATGKISTHREVAETGALEEFWARVVGEFLSWAEEQADWEILRNASIATMEFPHANYRAGQRQLAVAVYRAIRDRQQLLAEAPTGIGKTVSVLFPAIKALGEGKARKIFYLTARTVGRKIAEETLASLRAKGLRLRSVTLTARDKICFKEAESCEALECPYATAYYDRVKPALREALKGERLQRDHIEALARRHSVCPFELSLDIAVWVDVIICDYNYAFDPGSYLRRFFDDDLGGYVFLVDEAHQLPERARDMFSAALSTAGIDEDIAVIRAASAEAADALAQVRTVAETFCDKAETSSSLVPEPIVTAAESFLTSAEPQLIRNEPGPTHDRLLERFFEASRFVRVAEDFDSGYVTIGQKQTNGGVITLFCADPTAKLQEALLRADSAIFFSATLSPLNYFREIFAGKKQTAEIRLRSPFAADNFALFAHRQIETTYKQRSASAPAVAETIVAACAERVGNYLVFFPSFQYLEEVLDKVRPLSSAAIIAQTPQMSEADRDAFLKSFAAEPAQTQIGFAVLGGIFGEGIDLIGDRLIGAIIVGVGLPQLCLERDLISKRFAARQLDGYDFAYRFPGMNRVLQAAGRVIRTETDRGFVLLIDRRFAESRYRELFPPHWAHAKFFRDNAALSAALKAFWQNGSNPA